jgi:DNA repair protein RadC
MFDDDKVAATIDGQIITGLPVSLRYRPKVSRHRSRASAAVQPDSRADAALLTNFLGIVLDRSVALGLADDLLHVFGSFAEVIAAPLRDLETVCGSAKGAASLLKGLADAAMRLSRAELLSRPAFRSTKDLFPYLTASLARERVECVQLLYLNARNRLIGDEMLVRGDVRGAPLTVAMVLRAAIINSASAVVLAHNHPSGDPQPSRADIELTANIHSVLRAAGIALHDHVVVAREGCASLRQLGLWPATG